MRISHILPVILTTLFACTDDGGAGGSDLGDAAFAHYEGTVSFTATGLSATQTGSVAFSVDLTEHRAADLDALEGTIQGSFEYTPQVPSFECAPIQITAPLETSLMVYESTGSIRGANDLFASKIQINVTGNAGVLESTQCCLVSSPGTCTTKQFAPNLAVQTGCAPATFPTYNDRANLAGSGTFECNGALQSDVTWSLVGSN